MKNGPISPIYKLVWLMKSRDTQWRKRTWVPSLSKGRLLRPSTDCSPYNARWKCEWKNSKLTHSNERWKAYEMVLIVSITKEWVSDNLNSITLQWIPWRNGSHSWLFIAKHWAIMHPPFECEERHIRAHLGLWPAPHADWARIRCQIELGADPLVVGRPTSSINAPFGRRAGFAPHSRAYALHVRRYRARARAQWVHNAF